MPIIQVGPRSGSELQEIADALGKSRKIVVLTGAGISTNCGIPDFRSRDGLYSLIQDQYEAALKNPPWGQSNTFEIDDRPRKKRKQWYYEIVAPDGKVLDVIDDELPQPQFQEFHSRKSSSTRSTSTSTRTTPALSCSSSTSTTTRTTPNLSCTSSQIKESKSMSSISTQSALFDQRYEELNSQLPANSTFSTSKLSTKNNRRGLKNDFKSKVSRKRCGDKNSFETPPTDLNNVSTNSLNKSGEDFNKKKSKIMSDNSRDKSLGSSLPQSSSCTLPNLKGRDLFDAMIWSDPFKTSIFFMFMTSFRKKVKLVQSTSEAHRFFKVLRDSGRLVRTYTQNIDCLEEREGLSTDLTLGPGNRARFQAKNQRVNLPENPSKNSDHFRGVEAVLLHGSLHALRCGVCSRLCDWDEDDRISTTSKGSAPDCPHCTANNSKRRRRGGRELAVGRLRPDIVLYGEEHPNSSLIFPLVTHDLSLGPDMLLVMGTSLKVHGLKVIVKEFAKAVHDKGGKVVFVNQTKPPDSTWADIIDYWVDWDCDKWILDLKERRKEIWLPQGAASKNNAKRSSGGMSKSSKFKRGNSSPKNEDKSSGAYYVSKIMSTLARENPDLAEEKKKRFRRRSFRSYTKKSSASIKMVKNNFLPKVLEHCFSTKSSHMPLNKRDAQLTYSDEHTEENTITSYLSKNWSRRWANFLKDDSDFPEIALAISSELRKSFSNFTCL